MQKQDVNQLKFLSFSVLSLIIISIHDLDCPMPRNNLGDGINGII